MADKWIATSQIRYLPIGSKDRSELKVFEPGEEVTNVPKEYMDRLVEVGSVAKSSELNKREAPEGESDLEKDLRKQVAERDAEIASLKQKLEAAEAKQNAPVSTPTGTAAKK